MLMLLTTSISLIFLPMMNTKTYWVSLTIWWAILSFKMITLIPNNSYMLLVSSPNLYIDYISIPILILTFWISMLMMMASYKIFIQKDKSNLFASMVTILTIVLLMSFSASNLLTFYLFFETSLIPTMMLILMWGVQPERLQATFYFLLYTITASLPLLLSISMMYKQNNTTMLIMALSTTPNMSYTANTWWLMTIMAFLVKMPMFTTHLWLPKAHVEAPVAGSMILAAVLLKLGSYGMMRLTLMLPMMTNKLAPLLISVSIIGATLTSLICIRQPDMKSMIAYSSVGHMGLLLAAMSTSSIWGMEGALTMTIAHGLSSSAMFAAANMMYEITHTRSMYITKGFITFMPSFSMWLFLILAANMAAPPSINLISEIIILTTIMSSTNTIAIMLIMISFLTGAYSLILFTASQHGTETHYMNPLTPMPSRNSMILILHTLPLFSMALMPAMMTIN